MSQQPKGCGSSPTFAKGFRLRTRIIGLVPVTGLFGEFSGSGTVSPGGKVSGRITVAAASIDTKNKKRDTHLRSADFFDTDKYSGITFTRDGVQPFSDTTTTGELTVRGRAPGTALDEAVPSPGHRPGSMAGYTSTGRTSASPGIRWAWS